MRKAFILAYLLSPGNVAIGTSPKFYQQNVLKIPEMIVASHNLVISYNIQQIHEVKQLL